MFWITKYRHNKIVEQYQKNIDDLREALWRKEKFEEITEKLAEISVYNGSKIMGMEGCCVTGSGELRLPDDVARYVPDYFGGQVIKQEAYPVTILDENGKATYALTATKPDKNKRFILEYKF